MVKHLGIGTTFKSGTVQFDNQKVAKVDFDEPFQKHPSVDLTLEDSGANHVPYKTKVKKTQFRIVLKNPYTGLVSWQASESLEG